MEVHLQFTKYNSGRNNDAKKNHDEINSYSKCVSLKIKCEHQYTYITSNKLNLFYHMENICFSM